MYGSFPPWNVFTAADEPIPDHCCPRNTKHIHTERNQTVRRFQNRTSKMVRKNVKTRKNHTQAIFLLKKMSIWVLIRLNTNQFGLALRNCAIRGPFALFAVRYRPRRTSLFEPSAFPPLLPPFSPSSTKQSHQIHAIKPRFCRK